MHKLYTCLDSCNDSSAAVEQFHPYSLPLVIAFGNRVRSARGTQFRRGATQSLQEYLVKRFVMDKNANQFFQIIQNKLHFASTGLTAARFISQRMDASKPNMGLTSFKNVEEQKNKLISAWKKYFGG